MKKMFLTLSVIGCLFAGDTVVPPNEKYKINTSDMWYLYNFPKKKCELSTFQEKADFINGIRAENVLITEKYINDAGVTYMLNYDNKGTEFTIAVMNNYGECRLFEDVMVKGLDVKAKDYVGLKK